MVYRLNSRQEGADTSSTANMRVLKLVKLKSFQGVSPEITRKRKSETGAPTPPAKKPKTFSKPSSDSELEGESFDMTFKRKDKDDFEAKVPRAIEKYIFFNHCQRKNVQQCIRNQT